MWNVTGDTWHVPRDMWHVTVGGRWTFSQNSAFYLLRFVIYDILKIWRKMLTQWLNELINYEGVCRTAPATPGLLKLF